MKSIRTYLSMYPTSYKIVFLIGGTMVMLGLAFLAANIDGAQTAMTSSRLMTMGGYAFAGVMLEMYGEMFSLGALCSRKNSFGELVLSSSKGRLFAKRFAVVDALRKLIIYLLFPFVAGVIAKFTYNPTVPLGAVFGIGVATSLASILEVYVYRKIKLQVLQAFWMMLCVMLGIGLATVFAFPTVPGFVILGLTVFVAAFAIGFSLLSIRSIVKGLEEDFYD